MTTLFKKDSKGRMRIWTIRTEGPEIIENYGLITGKQARNNKTCKGKNLGRSNETSPEEQAKKEMISRVAKKRDEGYVDSRDQAENEQVLLPMLAKSFDKESRKVEYPCNVQPKLDGMRALYNNGKLISRQGKLIPTMGHLLLELKDCNVTLDGELYAHGESFQENMRLIKRYREGRTEKVCYHVYDIVEPNMAFDDRYALLRDIVSQLKTNLIRLVPCTVVYDEEEIKTEHKYNLSNEYEGSIVRWGMDGYKIGGRSSSLLKYKDFQDVTAQVIDVVPQDARPTHAMLICGNEMGVFSATPKVSFSEREQMLTDRETWIGKTVEIRYFEETESGLPRFPIMVGERLDK